MIYSHVFEILLCVYSFVYLCIQVSECVFDVFSALDGLYSSIIHFLSCWLYYFLPLAGLLLYFQRVWRKTEGEREEEGGERRAERMPGVMEGQRDR